MLVLSRRRDQKIVIGENITITIVEIRGDKVRIGIDAPREVPVHRQEVYESIQQEQRINSELQEAEEKKWDEWAKNKGRNEVKESPDECNRDANK